MPTTTIYDHGCHNWPRPCCIGHGVHFYADHSELAERVVEHLKGPLALGQAAMLVATPANMLAFEREAGRQGLDYTNALSEGRLVLFDAQWLMARFMVDGKPDERRFRAIVGGQVRMLAQRYNGIAIYGEIVALLMASSRYAEALELEGLWNELATERRFNLLCAYPMDLFEPKEHSRALEKIRSMHGYSLRTLPPERN
ncbi:MAG: MEDS domain-containing protein [Flavobacteriales bacterium]